MAYRALAGHPPFQAQKIADLFRMVTTAPRPSLFALRPDLPRDIDAWVQQALAIDPNERFMTVRALWSALALTADVPVPG